MNTTEVILKLIKEKYKSVRQFSIAADIPYSTIKSGLKAGIGGMAVETVIKMCDVLDIKMESMVKTNPSTILKDQSRLFADEWYLVEKYRTLSDETKHGILNYLEYRSHTEKMLEVQTELKSKA